MNFFTPKLFDNQSFLNIRIEDKVILLTCFIDNHLIIDYNKGAIVKIKQRIKKRTGFRGTNYD